MYLLIRYYALHIRSMIQILRMTELKLYCVLNIIPVTLWNCLVSSVPSHVVQWLNHLASKHMPLPPYEAQVKTAPSIIWCGKSSPSSCHELL